MFAWLKRLFGKKSGNAGAPDRKKVELKQRVERSQDAAFKGMMVDARRSHPGSGVGYK